jgi:hypothetical protein
MKRLISIITLLLVVLSIFTSCANRAVTNLTWVNEGDLTGDTNGPCYSLYSKIGYGKASAVIKLSDVKVNLVRISDKKAASGFIFLGVNVYDKNKQWKTCVDAGIGKSGDGKWHAIMNRYQPSPGAWYDDASWWESSINLNDTHDYQIEVDTSKKDEQFTLNIYDRTDGNKLVDSKTSEVWFSKKDGSNVAIYQESSIGFGDDICKDTNGNDTDDYNKVVMYNTNQNLYLKNVNFEDVILYNSKGSLKWEEKYTRTRWMWPAKVDKMSYAVVQVRSEKKDYERIVDINLNNK